jgi:hypothetical protein
MHVPVRVQPVAASGGEAAQARNARKVIGLRRRLDQLCPVPRAHLLGGLPTSALRDPAEHGVVPTDSVRWLAFPLALPALSIMEALQQETDALRRMSPAQKLNVMRVLIRQAWELKAAVIRARQPELSETEIRARAWELVGGDRP